MKMNLSFFLGALAFGLVLVGTNAAPRRHRKHKSHEIFSDRQCGYDGCPKPKPNMINVHIVPHTHDDVGWLKTVDQYYYGSKSTIQRANVELIIDSVVQELLRDPTKRFIYVESAFFFKWWREQNDDTRSKVSQLVQEGRLEFIGGAWVMNDEATTHYLSVIDQFTWGLRSLNDTFGECGRPRVGWQIDPFGHAREFGSLLTQMGYDGLFLGRIDHEDKSNRLKNKEAEMIWRTSDALGSESDLFTGVLYNGYSPPPGFCFDILCTDEPIISDKRSTEYNLDRRAEEFSDHVEFMSQQYRSNNILLTMGEDFHYQDARMWYQNLDKLILHSNARQSNGSNINLFYSTPSCYLKALHDANIKWPTKTDDFFPYSSDPHAFWTGYFTSRPTLKRYERVGSHFLQVCKQLTALAPKRQTNFRENLSELREAMGIMQHHDAVTGTEKQHVADDYAYLLHKAIVACSSNTGETLNQLTIEEDNPMHDRSAGYNVHKRFEFDFCENLNISACEITEQNEKFIVTVYNTLAHSTFQYVRVPVEGNAEYVVKDYRDVPIEAQLVPIPDEIQSLKYRRSISTVDLVFLATELPPMGYKSFFIEKKNSNQISADPKVLMVLDGGFQSDQPTDDVEGPITIGGKHVNVSFDENGFLKSISGNGQTIDLTQNFFVYDAAAGNNLVFVNRSSGAYIFRPNVTQALPLATKAKLRVVNGPIVSEVHQVFNDWISQVVRVYRDENLVEFEWLVGSIPVDDGMGREIISRFDTDIRSKDIFFTDSNGREMLRRRRDRRDTWNATIREQIAGNYYPVTAKIAIEDDDKRFAILTDRAQGGSSLAEGSVELMVHRRLLYDDDFGVVEPLNETAYGAGLIARGKHYVVFGSRAEDIRPTVVAIERFTQLHKLLPGWLFFSDASDLDYNVWKDSYKNIYSALSLSLPQNIHLLTFEPWKQGSILIRFEHILSIDEDPDYAKSVTFNFRDIFRDLGVSSMRETSLGANQWLSDVKRFKFEPEVQFEDHEQRQPIEADGDATIEGVEPELRQLEIHPEISSRQYRNAHHAIQSKIEASESDALPITLQPMQIRTFVLYF